MNTTAQHLPNTLPAGRPGQRSGEHHGTARALLVVLVALGLLAAGLAGWQVGRATAGTSTSQVGTVADPMAPYRPGGSVYDEQVPRAEIDPWAPYRPGGYVYDQQVPREAKSSVAEDGASAATDGR
jgi:hypothetical protein